MSILVKGLGMPEDCAGCYLARDFNSCWITGKSYNWGLVGRPSDCPLIEVPTPHGKLIDADKLFTDMELVGWFNNADRDEIAEKLVNEAETVIPAEEDI